MQVPRLKRPFWVGSRSVGMTIVAVLCLCCAAVAQSNTARYKPVFENAAVKVDSLELPPHFHAPVYQNIHDVVWIALDSATLTFVNEENRSKADLAAGDVRFFPSFHTRSVWNDNAETAHALVIEITGRGLTKAGCGCLSNVEKRVCGCGITKPLPDFWALVLGDITLGGAVLEPGEAVRDRTVRGDTLLVAITELKLTDQIDGRETGIDLKPGEVGWFKKGRHVIMNSGEKRGKFVTVEF